MTHTRTFTREELALKRIVDQVPVTIEGERRTLDAIVRVNEDSYYVRSLPAHEQQEAAEKVEGAVTNLDSVRF